MGLSGSCFAVYARAAFCPVCSHGFKVYRQAGKTVGRISGVVHSAHNRENALASGDCHRLGNTLGTPVIHGGSESTLHPSAASTKGDLLAGQTNSIPLSHESKTGSSQTSCCSFGSGAGNPPGNFAFGPTKRRCTFARDDRSKTQFHPRCGTTIPLHPVGLYLKEVPVSSNFLELPVLYHI